MMRASGGRSLVGGFDWGGGVTNGPIWHQKWFWLIGEERSKTIFFNAFKLPNVQCNS